MVGNLICPVGRTHDGSVGYAAETTPLCPSFVHKVRYGVRNCGTPRRPATAPHSDPPTTTASSPTAHIESRGWNIHRAELGNANGYTDPESHRVTLPGNLTIEQIAETLIHESAHIELRHIDDVDEYRA